MFIAQNESRTWFCRHENHYSTCFHQSLIIGDIIANYRLKLAAFDPFSQREPAIQGRAHLRVDVSFAAEGHLGSSSVRVESFSVEQVSVEQGRLGSPDLGLD